MANVDFTCQSVALMSLFISEHLNQLEGNQRRQGSMNTVEEFACMQEFL